MSQIRHFFLKPFYLLFIYVIVWLRTWYYFRDDEIVVIRSAIYRSETRIQYDRLASVVVERSVVYRIFGATKLSFNLNSSVNVRRAEAFIVLEEKEAEKLRDSVYARMYGTSESDEPDAESHVPVVPDYDSMESLVEVSTGDIFLHSFLGMSTVQFAFGMVMLAYSILSLALNSPSLLAILIFGVEFFIPAIMKFFRYYNYRIVRDGETVVISSGLFATRQDTFELSKVNFVKIREPLICRAMGRAILEAEVVGTADGEGMPLLCPLKDRDIAVALFRSLLPEFQCDAELKSQSKVSLYAITLWMAVTLAVSVGLFYLVMYEVPMEYAMFVNAVFVLVLAFTLGWGLFAYRIRRFSMTDTIALLVTGSFDRISNYVLIDKVQFADIRTSPVMRRTGTARCSVNMLSTMGYSNIRSGVFDLADLEALPATVLGRIKDGRYDFRKYQ